MNFSECQWVWSGGIDLWVGGIDCVWVLVSVSECK